MAVTLDDVRAAMERARQASEAANRASFAVSSALSRSREGQRDAEKAMEAFHSALTALAFALEILNRLPVAELLEHQRRETMERAIQRAEVNERRKKQHGGM